VQEVFISETRFLVFSQILSHDGRQHSVRRYSNLLWVRLRTFWSNIFRSSNFVTAFKERAGKVSLRLANARHSNNTLFFARDNYRI